MKRTLSAVEARQRFGEVIEGVFYRGDEVVIERAGKAMAVVVPVERYETMQRSRERLFELVEQNWERNKNVPYDKVTKEIAAAIADARIEAKPARRRR